MVKRDDDDETVILRFQQLCFHRLRDLLHFAEKLTNNLLFCLCQKTKFIFFLQILLNLIEFIDFALRAIVFDRKYVVATRL